MFGYGDDFYTDATRQKQQQGQDEARSRYQEWFKDSQHPGLRRLDTITPKEVEFLWREHIPVGEVTLIDGLPEIGKSWLCFAIAAELTKIGKNVLYICNEDAGETVATHRMKLLGADFTHFWSFCDQITRSKVKLVLPRNALEFSLIGELIAKADADLVLINPMASFLPPGVSPFKSEQTRPIFDCMTAFSREYQFSWGVIRHFNKASDMAGILRGQGGVDIAGAARAALGLVLHPDYPYDETQDKFNKHVLVKPTKSNNGVRPPCLAYHLQKDKFEWIETRYVSDDEAFQKPVQVETVADREIMLDLVKQIEAVFASFWPEKVLTMSRLKNVLSGYSTNLLRQACHKAGVVVSHHQEKGRIMEHYLEWTREAPPKQGPKKGK